MQIAIIVLFVLTSLFFGIVFLVNWLRYFKETIPFTKLGLGAGLVYLVLQTPLLFFAIRQVSDPARITPLIIAVFLLPIGFFKIYVTLTLGCHYARQLGYPAFPFLGSFLEDRTYPEPPETCPAAFEETDDVFEPGNDVPETGAAAVQAVEPAAPATIDIGTNEMRRRLPYAWAVVLVVAGAILYSYLLFWLIRPEPGKQLRLAASDPSVLAILLMALLAGCVEEIVFRLGVQNFLAKVLRWTGSKYWLAIVIAAAFWTTAHVNVLDPYWVKLAQIFPIGLALGWLNWKYGTESSIIAHIAFNLIGIPLLAPLIDAW